MLSIGMIGTAGATSSAAAARLVTMNDQAQLQVRSLSTGRVVRNLGRFPRETDNGFALAPGGGAVYLVLIGSHALIVEQVSTTTGRGTKIGDGADPAVSPNGRYLAWATGRGFRDLDLRDIATGKTRTIGIARLVGPGASLLSGPHTVVWLGNDELAALPSIDPTLTATSTAKPAVDRARSCSSITKGTCIILVHPFTSEAGQHARLEVAPLEGFVDTDADGAQPAELILALFALKHTEIVRIDLAGRAPKITDLFAIPAVVPMAFGPDGNQLLYLRGHGPVALWSASIGTKRLRHNRQILSRSDLREVVW